MTSVDATSLLSKSSQSETVSRLAPPTQHSTKEEVEGAQTCFTLAAMHRVRAEVTLLAIKLLTFSENERMPERSTTWGAGPRASSFHRPMISPTSPAVEE